MKVLFDTNVILDVLLNRQPFAPVAVQLFADVEYQKIQGYISVTTVTTIFYLATKTLGTANARLQLKQLLSLFQVAEVNQQLLQNALMTGFSDFEDAVLAEAARLAKLDVIVTRNIKDFKLASLPVYLPEELAAMLVTL